MLWFDVEARGLLDEITGPEDLYMIGTIDEEGRTTCYQGPGIEEGLRILSEADAVCGHNIIGYDLPLLRRVYPDFKITGKVRDTLVMSRLAFPNLKETDWQKHSADPEAIPKELIGRQSLKAWGHRLGLLKGNFGDEVDWASSGFSKEMMEYCFQDCRVTLALWELLEKQHLSEDAVRLEHSFAVTLLLQELHGFGFDREKAEALAAQLVADRAELDDQLQESFPPIEEEYETPKKKIKKTRTIAFNPSSRVQIGERFKAMGWEPKDFTPDGRPKIDEGVLKGMPYPEAKVLLKSLMLDKRLGQLVNGKNALLKLVRDNSRIHGRVLHIGSVSGRCSHMNPNVAQIPNIGSEYGKEFRELFTVPPGYKLVGVDLKSAELRVLAGYLHKFDGGKYMDIVLNQDVHQANADALEISRPQAKTAVYCWLYGGSAQLLGEVVGGGAKEGKELQAKWYAKMPALKKFKQGVMEAAKRGHLWGLDRRKLPVRSPHSAVNLLLQSGAALLCKNATVLLHRRLADRLAYGVEWAMVAHVHDELQLEVIETHAEEVAEEAVRAIGDSSGGFSFPCPMAADFSVGDSWAETH
jgi:DNA polymerase I-like protein with 3'-5' exonuclease and polymerase domains